MVDWLLRLLKGALIGTGFILPGVSGGALAAIFGLYEKIIAFIGNITKNFFKNFLYFLPVGIGALAGIFVLSFPLSFFMSKYQTELVWGFIGCMIGAFPALWKEAGKKRRSTRHYIILVLATLIAFCFLYWAKLMFRTQVPLVFGTWVIAGVLIALGILVPGMASSNFLVYMGMYAPMVDAFKTINLSVIVPIFIGGAACLFSLSKAFDILFKSAHTGFFHIILGVVIASTVMILPGFEDFSTYFRLVIGYDFISLRTLVCLAALIVGFALGFWMGELEEKYT